MKDDFNRNIAIVVALLLGLVALDRLPHVAGHARGTGRLTFVINEMHNSELNPDDSVTRANGYYEGIQHTVRLAPGVENEDYRLRDDFMRYEFKPNLKRRYEAGMRITNSLGMPNREYDYEKPPHTRRIALVGDSVSVGPYGLDYPALLEDRLNQTQLRPEIQTFQLLNFAVPGYILGQKMEVALEKVPKFHPDVYLVQLSMLEVGGTANHISRLVVSGLDLKYDFLKRTAAQAGVQSDDPRSVVRFKLAPYFASLTRWSLENIRDHAAAQGAGMVILLINPVVDAGLTATYFNQLHEVTDTIGVPVIDLRDTFKGANFPSLQVIPGADPHPNVRGHEMLFEDLYTKFRAQPDAWAALTGNAGKSSRLTF